jgi:cytochrome c biogenesis protein
MATTETELSTSTAEAPPASVSKVTVSSPNRDSVLDKLLRLLSSVRFGIVMLSIVLLCCMIGMLVMQVNVDGFQKYYENLKPAQKLVYGALGFFDIYRKGAPLPSSPLRVLDPIWPASLNYFQLFLSIIGLNIILASIDRFPAAWQYIRKPKLTASPKFIAAQMFNAQEVMNEPPARAAEKIREIWWKQRWQAAIKLQFWVLLVLGLVSVVEIALRVGKVSPLIPAAYLVVAWLGYLALVVSLWLKKRKGSGWVHITDENGRLTVFGERQALNRLGAYAVHVALLTIFTGGFLTSRGEVGGAMEIKPGRISDRFARSEITLEGPRESQEVLPFEIECTDLQQKLIRPEGGLDNSNTIDWLSYIRIIDKKHNVSQDMLVHLNNVGDYRGYRFFQNSFQPVGNARQITITFEPAAGGGAPLPPVTIKRNGSAEVPGLGTVRYVNFYPDFDVDESGPTTLSRDYNNPAAQLEIVGPEGKRSMFFAFNPQLSDEYLTKANEKIAKEGGENPLLVNGNKIILRDFEKVSLTHTLTISYDPGRTPVYIGFTLLVMALCGVFFFSHQRIWAVIEPNGSGSKIHFGGNTNRNRPAFEGRFNTLVQSVTGGSKHE